jgi:hypothetical protein
MARNTAADVIKEQILQKHRKALIIDTVSRGTPFSRSDTARNAAHVPIEVRNRGCEKKNVLSY